MNKQERIFALKISSIMAARMFGLTRQFLTFIIGKHNSKLKLSIKNNQFGRFCLYGNNLTKINE